MPIRRNALTPQFTFDDATGQYRSNASGRFVPRTTIRTALDRFIDDKSVEARAFSEQLRNRTISSETWQNAMEENVFHVHLANAAAAVGGWDRLTDAHYAQVGKLVAEQLGGIPGVHKGLRGFAQKIANGLPLDGSFLRRAGSYMQAGRRTYHIFDREQQGALGNDEERSIRHARDSCASCIAAEEAGRQPRGTQPLPGERQCQNSCHCSMEYRQSEHVTLQKQETKEENNPYDKPTEESHRTSQAVLKDAQRIEAYLNRYFDTKSRWSGHLEVDDAVTMRASGRFNFDEKNGLQISSQVAGLQAARWSTLLHEMLHSIEVEYSKQEYVSHFGWVEGVLEQTLRLTRSHMLGELKVDVPEDGLKWRDKNHVYQPFVRALEGIRAALGKTDAEAFYATLFATPVTERPDKIRAMTEGLPYNKKRQVLQSLRGALKVLGGD